MLGERLGARVLRQPKGAASSFFNMARFEPDTLGVFGFLAATGAALLLAGSAYLSLLTFGVLLVIFAIESLETITLDRVEERRIVGARCLVLKRASAGERGLARLLRADGGLEQELWSVEASSPVAEGEVALVSGMRSVILVVAPVLGSEVKQSAPPPGILITR